MSGVVAFIRRCLAAGMDQESALCAAEQFEAQPAASASAARQRRYRERKAASRVTSHRNEASQSVTRYAPPLPKDTQTLPSPTNQNQNPSPPVVPRKAKSRRCPADWLFSPSVYETALREGLNSDERERELAMLRDHEFRDAHSDWDAVARNWLRKAGTAKRRDGGTKSLPFGTAPAKPQPGSWGAPGAWIDTEKIKREAQERARRQGLR